MSGIRVKQIVVLSLLGVTALYTRVYYKPARHVFSSPEFTRRLKNFPRQIGSWQYEGDIFMNEAGYKALGPQALIFRKYANSKGESVVLTIVYHENQRWGAHDVEVCYTSQGWTAIKENGLSVQKIFLKRPGLTVNKMEVENPQARQTVVYWWFTQGKHQMADRLEQMLNNVCSSLLHGYCASGLVRISAKGEEGALAALSSFIEQLMPILENHLP